MARRMPPRRNKSRDGARRGKKKVSPLTIAKVDFVDYKDTDMLRKFVSERSKLKTRQNTGNNEKQQREVARAVKNAREMALIPYTNRVTTQRRERRSDDRSARADGPPPRPTAPPPGSGDEATTEELEAAELVESVEVVETIEAEMTDEPAESLEAEVTDEPAEPLEAEVTDEPAEPLEAVDEEDEEGAGS